MDKLLIAEERYGRKGNNFENNEFIDRLNSRYTVYLLMISIFIITGKIFISNAIVCWTPAQFSGTHNDYAHTICWLKGSYYLPTDNITIPDRSQPRVHYVSYYQWTPLILLLMANFFILPKFIWDAATRHIGIDLRPIINSLKKEDEEKSITIAVNKIDDYLRTTTRGLSILCCDVFAILGRNSLTITFGLLKIYQILNVFIQWLCLHSFLAFNFLNFRYEAFANFFASSNWFESPRFPRVTMCDFMIRHLGSNQHWYAVQCSLPINIYHEKIFFLLWIWLIILIILNLISLISWAISLSLGRQRRTIKYYLSNNYPSNNYPDKKHSKKGKTSSDMSQSPDTDSTRAVDDDFMDYLGVDGTIILRLISYNTNTEVASKITKQLHDKLKAPSRSNTKVETTDNIPLLIEPARRDHDRSFMESDAV